MDALATNLTNCIELDWYDGEELVRVTPRNQERFQVQKDRAIEILQLVKDADRFDNQFALLLKTLAQWIRQHEEKIDRAIVTLQDATLAFIVVQRAAKYDEAIVDALAELDFGISNDPDLELVKLKTLALPNVTGAALESFLDKRLLLVYHGDGNRTPDVGEPQP